MKAWLFALMFVAAPAQAAVDPALFSGKTPFKAFVPIADLAPVLTAGGEVADANRMDAEVAFEGRLSLTPLVPGGSKIVVNDHAYGISNDAALAPPAFSVEIVGDGERLYPTVSAPLTGADAGWEVLVGPGYVWREANGGEGGRISFSLTLKEPNANCLHNGVLTLAFDRTGLKPVALYEIASETCAYFKFNLWGAMKVAFTPGVPAGKAEVLAREADIRAHRLPVKMLSDLGVAGLLAKPFGAVEVTDPATSYGLIVDGTVYAGDCATRFGPNPLCADTDLPSYSTAKTIFGAAALMRLEALYPGTADSKVTDLVPECASWGEVRLIDALDMATGRYDSNAYQADEDSDDMSAFFLPDDHARRIGFACGHYARKSDPGESFVYHTSDTYVLGTALQAVVREKTGGDAYDTVLRPLWRDMHLSARLDYTQRTKDAAAQPMTGYGLVYRRDDALRIAGWMFGEGQGLDARLHAEAVQGMPDKRGLIAFPPNYRYQHGVWARNIAPVIGCAYEVWVPFMSGFGGITVARLSPRISFYFYGDSQQFDWTQAVLAAQKIGDLCA